MRWRSWIVPVLAVVAAIAVGVAGTILGGRLATPRAVDVPSGTEVVPVLAPVAVGEEPPAEGDEGEDASGVAPYSPVTAQRDVPLPGADGAIDPALDEVLRALADAADPVFELIELDAESDAIGTDADDDPCAPRDGEPSEDCPDGLRSTVLSLTGLVDFRAGGQAFPPTREEFLEHGNPIGGSIWCDGLEATDTAVPFGIVATAPGDFAVRLSPTGRPGETTTFDVATAAADRDAYLAAIDEGTDPLSLGMPRHCLLLDGLEPDTDYTAVVSGVDVFDRRSEPHTLRFSTAGEPVRPGAQITTVGENLVFVAAPHQLAQTAEARAIVVDDAETPSCAIPDGSRRLHPLTDVTVEVDAETLADLNFRRDFVRKRVQTFVVPEGSTVLVCVRWYQAGSAPSWERVQPIYESSAVLRSPDRVLPALRLDAVEGYHEDVDRIEVAIATAEGTSCGLPFRWRPDGDIRLPLVLCEQSLRDGGVRTDGDRLWDVGFSGDLVARVTATTRAGASATTSFLIPAVDGGCRGECEPPARRWYTVYLDDVTEPIGLCGSVFGAGCTAPTRDVAAGRVQLSVGWEQGASNGAAAWSVTPTVDVAPEYERPSRPQLDLDQRWTTGSPTRTSPAVTASFPLVVDRPVDFTMRLTLAPGEAASSCRPDGGPLEVSGSSTGRTTVSIPGACAGELYQAELELRDEDGGTVTWGLVDRDAWWGGGALVDIPAFEVVVDYQLRAQGYTRSQITEARIQLGSSGVDLAASLDRCDEDGVIATTGSFPARLAATSQLVLTLRLQESGVWSPDDCERGLDGAPAQSYLVEVDYADLLGPTGVVIESPDTFRSTLRLIARPAG